MKSIDIDASRPSKDAILGQTMLRLVSGGLLALHGAHKWLAHVALSHALSGQFADFGVDGETGDALAYALSGIEIAAGIGLIFGRFTRTSALMLIVSTALGVAAEQLHLPLFASSGVEQPLLLTCVGLFFLLVGGGPASLDTAFRERARRKAIQNDPIWTQPPYVANAARRAAHEGPWSGPDEDTLNVSRRFFARR
ncbi:MAG: hypothetical protein RL701_2254 [Pseudomonadota bacterium]|jgi:uncharacterized membrane protein YphA (DoxX/SURF4 family)